MTLRKFNVISLPQIVRHGYELCSTEIYLTLEILPACHLQEEDGELRGMCSEPAICSVVACRGFQECPSIITKILGNLSQKLR
jgi:hypothetical protein